MNPLLLYLLLLKATLTTFSGLASLPVLREDLVVTRHAVTDEQLNRCDRCDAHDAGAGRPVRR